MQYLQGRVRQDDRPAIINDTTCSKNCDIETTTIGAAIKLTFLNSWTNPLPLLLLFEFELTLLFSFGNNKVSSISFFLLEYPRECV